MNVNGPAPRRLPGRNMQCNQSVHVKALRANQQGEVCGQGRLYRRPALLCGSPSGGWQHFPQRCGLREGV